MRDVVSLDRDAVYSYTRDHVPKPSYLQNTAQSYSSSSMVKRSARDSIHHGNHVTATAYWAYKIEAYPLTFDLQKVTGPFPFYEFSGGKWKRSNYNIERRATGKFGIENQTVQFFGLNPTNNYRPYVPASVHTEAKNKVLRKLKDSAVNLSVTIGEINSTAREMSAVLARIFRSIIALAKGKFSKAVGELGVSRKATKNARSAAEWYLAWQFGIKPLLSDLTNGRQAILDAFSKDPVVRCTAESSYISEDPFSFLYPSHSFSNGTVKVGVQYGVVGKVQSRYIDALATLGLLNPLSTAWELLPLSFIVNWFISIGDFLDALSGRMGLDFVSGYYTEFVHGKVTITRSWTPDGKSGWSGTPPSWVMTAFSHVRTPTYDFPIPSVRLNGGVNSVGKGLTLAALAAVGRFGNPSKL